MEMPYMEFLTFVQLKTRITSENWEYELKALKSEIRALQVSKLLSSHSPQYLGHAYTMLNSL